MPFGLYIPGNGLYIFQNISILPIYFFFGLLKVMNKPLERNVIKRFIFAAGTFANKMPSHHKISKHFMTPLFTNLQPAASRIKSRLVKIGVIICAGLLSAMFLPALAEAQVEAPASADELALGQRIYLEGTLATGAALTGQRFGNNVAPGASSACVNCHRRSGMGSVEGDIQVPPITGTFLFADKDDKPLATMDPRVSKRFNQSHEAYTESTLAEAIIRGTNNRGREMNVLMPRYNLTGPEMKGLAAYLKQLSSQWSPGVTVDNIRFATVITPDVDPLRRKVFIDMMRTIFRQKNGSTMTATKQGTGRRHMVSAAELVLGTERKWTLDIWELQGAPETWGEQLATHYRNQPVFALVSGLTNSTWQPVHDFCDSRQIPFWFPSAELPVLSESPYSIYFSRGVVLEADILAQYLKNRKDSSEHLIQIFHNDNAGRAASQKLTQALAGSATRVENRMLPDGEAINEALNRVMANIKPGDAVMFWLRPDDMLALNNFKPVSNKNYFSAILAKAEHAPLPEDWKVNSHLVYPYELPEMRETNLAYFHAWLNIGKQPLVDEVMQSEAFFALNFMTDTVAEMLNNVYREYLLERAETMLGKREGSKVEQESRDRAVLGRAGDLMRKHGDRMVDEGNRIPLSNQPGMVNMGQGTSIYPRLSLGPGQRFASKGGYIVRFENAKSEKLIAESDLIVP
jgi:cytochrome c553